MLFSPLLLSLFCFRVCFVFCFFWFSGNLNSKAIEVRQQDRVSTSNRLTAAVATSRRAILDVILYLFPLFFYLFESLLKPTESWIFPVRLNERKERRKRRKKRWRVRDRAPYSDEFNHFSFSPSIWRRLWSDRLRHRERTGRKRDVRSIPTEKGAKEENRKRQNQVNSTWRHGRLVKYSTASSLVDEKKFRDTLKRKNKDEKKSRQQQQQQKKTLAHRPTTLWWLENKSWFRCGMMITMRRFLLISSLDVVVGYSFAVELAEKKTIMNWDHVVIISLCSLKGGCWLCHHR